MMTLEEAIVHAREKADENRKYAKECEECGNRKIDKFMKLDKIHQKDMQSCIKCAEEHEQLAEWLEELNILRLQRHLEREEIYADGYNKAVDDFASWMHEKHLTDLSEYIAWWQEEIYEAEPLKEGE